MAMVHRYIGILTVCILFFPSPSICQSQDSFPSMFHLPQLGKDIERKESWAWAARQMSSAHSPSFLSLHLRHSSFSNPSLALPTSQLILQPFHCFTYVTTHSPTLLLLLHHHRIFTYVTWRAAHDPENGRCWELGRRGHRQSGLQYTYEPWPSSPEFLIK